MADPITWYALGRAVLDPETIMEAMDAKLLVHNTDPSAHGQENESVYEHRIAAELDHVYGSASLKYLSANKIMIMSAFESVDGWLHSSLFAPGILYTRLETLDVINDEAYALAEADGEHIRIDFAKNPFFQTSLFAVSSTSQLAYFGTYHPSYTAFADSFGFKFVNANLYAFVYVGNVEYAIIISGVAVNLLHCYRAFVDSSTGYVYFYVDGVLVHTEVTHLPTGTCSIIMRYFIKATTAVGRILVLADLLFEQDR